VNRLLFGENLQWLAGARGHMAQATGHIAQVAMLRRLSGLGVSRLMSADCTSGGCALRMWEESRVPLPPDLPFTAIYSRRDGIVDWRACIDREAHAIEVTSSHVGMALDPRVVDVVTGALRLPASGVGSVLEVDSGESA